MGKRPMTVKQRARAWTALKDRKMKEKCDVGAGESFPVKGDEVLEADDITLPAYVRNEMLYERRRYKQKATKDVHARAYISKELLYETKRREKIKKPSEHLSDDHIVQYDETDIVPHLSQGSYGINFPSDIITCDNEPVRVPRSDLVYSSNLQNICDDISTGSDPKTNKQIFYPSNQAYFGITVTSAVNIARVLCEEERQTTAVLMVEKLNYTMKQPGGQLHTNGICEVDFSVGKSVPALCHIAVSDEVDLDARIRILFSGIVDAGFENILIDPNVSDGDVHGEVTRILIGYMYTQNRRTENIIICGVSADIRDTFLHTCDQILTEDLPCERHEKVMAHGYVQSKIPKFMRPEGWVRPLDRQFPKRFISPLTTIPKKLAGIVFFFVVTRHSRLYSLFRRYVHRGHSAESIRQDILSKLNEAKQRLNFFTDDL